MTPTAQPRSPSPVGVAFAGVEGLVLIDLQADCWEDAVAAAPVGDTATHKLLLDAARAARAHGGLCLVSFVHSFGSATVAGSVMVAIRPCPPDMGGLEALPGPDDSHEHWAPVQLAGVGAAFRSTSRKAVALPGAEAPIVVREVEYVIPLPCSRDAVVMCFVTPSRGFDAELTELFDAMAQSCELLWEDN